MDLKKEQILKSKLGLILKILLIAVAIFKLADLVWDDKEKFFTGSDKENEDIAVIDSVVDKNDETKVKEVMKPLANAASIYIFGANGLDRETGRRIGAVFFNDYKLMGTPPDYVREDLLLGNLSSSANTELVCVGTVSYSYWRNSKNDTTCNLDIYFDTFNKNTGEKVKHLSKSIFKKGVGIGNDKNGARQMALQRVQP
ncbi:hypothetical protein [Maribacter sp. 2304DJ31-5]|uniref:hypothetical protein n=1 Tax=Maribacter sp. 2304DJ31-5 TaxID=3386273 RepID=UPI0039BCD315